MFQQREKKLYLEFEMEKNNIAKSAKAREHELSEEIKSLKKINEALGKKLENMV